MKVGRLMLRAAAIVLAHIAVFNSGTTRNTVRADCKDKSHCSSVGEDYCWSNGSTTSNHCHMLHGQCIQGTGGSCES